MPDEMPWTDCHVHLVDFLQEPVDPATLARALTGAGADRAVVFGLPVKKKWSVAEPERPGYYLDGNDPCGYHSATDGTVVDLVPRLEAEGLAVAPLVCGFDPTDQLAPDHLRRVWAGWDRWRGVGEVLLRHDDLTNLTIGETPRPDHPAMVAVLQAAAGRGFPVSVHQDTGSTGQPSAQQYVPAFERMLEAVPEATVVWCHAGSTRALRPHDQLDLVGRLLGRHGNLVVEVSWVLLDQVVADGEVDPRWVGLVASHPDRVVVGSDTVADHATVSRRGEQVQRFLAALPGADRELVARGNADRLWFDRG